jgi:hypothetical protein
MKAINWRTLSITTNPKIAPGPTAAKVKLASPQMTQHEQILWGVGLIIAGAMPGLSLDSSSSSAQS